MIRSFILFAVFAISLAGIAINRIATDQRDIIKCDIIKAAKTACESSCVIMRDGMVVRIEPVETDNETT